MLTGEPNNFEVCHRVVLHLVSPANLRNLFIKIQSLTSEFDHSNRFTRLGCWFYFLKVMPLVPVRKILGF
jgi:hypothetical protein